MPGLDVRVLGASRHVALLYAAPAIAFEDHAGIDTLDGRTWLVGQVRLDARDDLARRLDLPAGVAATRESDARLCLHAYARWGEACVEHLAGDFAFLVWDEARQLLFAARDQMGKRCLFHGRRGGRGAIADNLDWVVARAAPDRRPDDYWMADFLTTGSSREFHRTAYRDVSRLAPAHVLRWGGREATVRRYWRLAIDEPLHLPRPESYAERFRDLVTRAVADRRRGVRLGISMSGGLDSTTLAACAVRQAGDPSHVVAYCEHYEEIMHIEEDVYAAMAARHLGIDLEIERFDDLAYDPQWQTRGIRTPEPLQFVVNAHYGKTINDRLAARAPVWFEGEGPDNALRLDRDPYLGWLRRRGDWRRYVGALADYAAAKGIAGWWESLRRHVRPAPPPIEAPDLPDWLDPGFAHGLKLRQRIDDLGRGSGAGHPWHPDALDALTNPIWSAHFSEFDAVEALSPMQWRHPFVDLRVLGFLVAVPPIPWAWKKKLLRDAMKGWLPDPVLRRPKTPLTGFPQAMAVQRHGLPRLLAPERLHAYLDPARLPVVGAPATLIVQSIAAYVVDHWLATMPQPDPPARFAGEDGRR